MSRALRRGRQRSVVVAMAVSTSLTLAVAVPLAVRAIRAGDGTAPIAAADEGVTPSPPPIILPAEGDSTATGGGRSPVADLAVSETDPEGSVRNLSVVDAGPDAAEGVVLTVRAQGSANITSVDMDAPWSCDRASAGWVCITAELDAGAVSPARVSLEPDADDVAISVAVRAVTVDPDGSDNQLTLSVTGTR